MTFTDFDEAYAFLTRMTNYETAGRFAPRGYVFRLERVRELMGLLDHPEAGWRALHIAGTKGKGSTAAMVESVARAQGWRTGLFTSPHVAHLCERIQREGEWISRQDFARVLGRVARPVEAMHQEDPFKKPTFFEIITAAAFLYFKELPVDVGVVEVGLGGRLDATNVLTPAACAVTHVGMDHTRELGDTLCAIAGEKAGILKHSVPAVTSARGEALAVIKQTAAQRNAPLEVVGEDIRIGRKPPCKALKEVFDLETPDRRYEQLEIPLLGAHQVANAALAVRLFELLGRSGAGVDERAVREGLASVALDARLEVAGQRPWIVIDGAHNVDSARALSQTLRERFSWQRLYLIAGISSDKDVDGFLREVLPLCDVVVATCAHSFRALLPGALAAEVRSLGVEDCREAPDIGSGLDVALCEAGEDDLVVVCGSFYLAGEAREALAARRDGCEDATDPV